MFRPARVNSSEVRVHCRSSHLRQPAQLSCLAARQISSPHRHTDPPIESPGFEHPGPATVCSSLLQIADSLADFSPERPAESLWPQPLSSAPPPDEPVPAPDYFLNRHCQVSQRAVSEPAAPWRRPPPNFSLRPELPVPLVSAHHRLAWQHQPPLSSVVRETAGDAFLSRPSELRGLYRQHESFHPCQPVFSPWPASMPQSLRPVSLSSPERSVQVPTAIILLWPNSLSRRLHSVSAASLQTSVALP